MNPLVILTHRVNEDRILSVRGETRLAHVTALAARIRILCSEKRRKLAQEEGGR